MFKSIRNVFRHYDLLQHIAVVINIISDVEDDAFIHSSQITCEYRVQHVSLTSYLQCLYSA